MINFERHSARHRVTFVPTAAGALLTALLEQVAADVI
jgi:hypothetical protein